MTLIKYALQNFPDMNELKYLINCFVFAVDEEVVNRQPIRSSGHLLPQIPVAGRLSETSLHTLYGIILYKGANCYIRTTYAILEAHCAARLLCLA